MPEATLTDLSTQADQIEARIQHLKTGINNIRQLQSLSAVPPTDLAEAQDELNQLQQTVEAFEATLASHLLSWSQLQEPFWQAVRYGGLGLVAGWMLHWLVRG
jgi:prefoldin subunit 5